MTSHDDSVCAKYAAITKRLDAEGPSKGDPQERISPHLILTPEQGFAAVVAALEDVAAAIRESAGVA